MIMIARLSVAFLLLAPALASACSYPEPAPFIERLSKSRSVSVIYVESARVYVDPQSGEKQSSRVEATIRIVSSLKGDPSFTSLVYSTSWCGGNRVDVGNYFIAATSQTGSTLYLAPADMSLLHLKYGYREDDAYVPHEVKHVRDFLANGTPLPEYFSDSYTFGFTQVLPPLPPPPCLPCKADGR